MFIFYRCGFERRSSFSRPQDDPDRKVRGVRGHADLLQESGDEDQQVHHPRRQAESVQGTPALPLHRRSKFQMKYFSILAFKSLAHLNLCSLNA